MCVLPGMGLAAGNTGRASTAVAEFIYTLPGEVPAGTAAGPGPFREESLNLCAHTSYVHPFLRERIYILYEAQQETSSFSRLPWESRGRTSG